MPKITRFYLCFLDSQTGEVRDVTITFAICVIHAVHPNRWRLTNGARITEIGMILSDVKMTLVTQTLFIPFIGHELAPCSCEFVSRVFTTNEKWNDAGDTQVLW